MSAQARSERERLRLFAAGLFDQGVDSGVIAGRLGVTRKSVNAWRRAWQVGGVEALVSKGPGGARCRLDGGQLAVLEDVLAAGPAASGWVEDQRWTLARVARVIADRFGVGYTLRGVSFLLHRLGYSPQVPQHVSARRDDEAIATWVRQEWPRLKGSRPTAGRGSASLTRPARL